MSGEREEEEKRSELDEGRGSVEEGRDKRRRIEDE
jgi:hypothetical protein